MIRDLVRFLDNVLQFFIDNAGDEISRARYLCYTRTLPWFGCDGLAFLSAQDTIFLLSPIQAAVQQTFKSLIDIKSEAVAETVTTSEQNVESVQTWKAQDGATPIYLAIAPNANSSIICGTSPSIEPSKANAYTHRTRAGSHLVKDKYLEADS